MRDSSNRENRQANAIYRTTTAKYGILSWATNPPTLWKDEVAFHFQKRADEILRTVEQWTRESRASPLSNDDGYRDPPMGNIAVGVDIGAVLQDLQKALQRYGATHKPEQFAPLPTYDTGGGNPFGRGGIYGGPRKGGGGLGGGHGSHFGSRFECPNFFTIAR
jgi:hypothetical protein